MNMTQNTPIKGFKAVRNDMTAWGNFKYEIGNDYKMDESPSHCQHGFHFCKELKSVLYYYRFNSRFFEVEAYGEVIDEGSKSCTNRIKLIREITDEVKQSEDLQLAAVKTHSYAIKFIETPSEQIQLAAVKGCGHAIQYIKNPSEKVKLCAVKQNGIAIEHIKDPSEEVQLAAVEQNDRAIYYIKNPYESVKEYCRNRGIIVEC